MQKKWTRYLQMAVATVGLTAGTLGWAAYPDRPITLIVPYGAGGTTDQIGRAVGDALSRQLNQTIIIENKPGAAGTMGAAQLKRAKPDGYTLSMLPLGVFRQVYLQPGGVSYDPLKDISYISMFAGYSFSVAVMKDAKWQTIQELVEDAKSRPGEIAYGSPGLFSGNHVVMAELERVTGAKFNHVPFKSDSESLTAMMGGHIDAASSTNVVVPFVASGQMRVLASAGKTRPKDLADAPTLQEAGYDVLVPSPMGIGAPANLPQDIVEKLDNAIKAMTQDPKFIEIMDRLGVEIEYADHKAYQQYAVGTMQSEKVLVDRLSSQLKD